MGRRRRTGWRKELVLWSLATVGGGLAVWGMGLSIVIRHVLWRNYPVFLVISLSVYVLLAVLCACRLRDVYPTGKKRWLIVIVQSVVCAWVSAAVGYLPELLQWHLEHAGTWIFSWHYLWGELGALFYLMPLASFSWLFGAVSALVYLVAHRWGQFGV